MRFDAFHVLLQYLSNSLAYPIKRFSSLSTPKYPWSKKWPTHASLRSIVNGTYLKEAKLKNNYRGNPYLVSSFIIATQGKHHQRKCTSQKKTTESAQAISLQKWLIKDGVATWTYTVNRATIFHLFACGSHLVFLTPISTVVIPVRVIINQTELLFVPESFSPRR